MLKTTDLETKWGMALKESLQTLKILRLRYNTSRPRNQLTLLTQGPFICRDFHPTGSLKD